MEDFFQKHKTEIRIKEKREAEKKIKKRGQPAQLGQPREPTSPTHPEPAQPRVSLSLPDRWDPPVITVITPPTHSPSQ
jgi:hypothetical protein